MIAEELINHMIPPLKPSDTAGHAIVWMEEFRCKQLPVVQKSVFLGFISEDRILEENEENKLIKDISLFAEKGFVHQDQHFYEVIKVASEQKIELVSVVDDNNQFVGVITIQDTITAFAQTTAVQAPGGIIVLSMKSHDYSLAELSRLVESNNARVLNSSIKPDEMDVNRVKVTLKINQEELTNVVATFERFGYKIIARFQENKVSQTDKDRLDILLRYLDI